jgi:hypothetical protein
MTERIEEYLRTHRGNIAIDNELARVRKVAEYNSTYPGKYTTGFEVKLWTGRHPPELVRVVNCPGERCTVEINYGLLSVNESSLRDPVKFIGERIDETFPGIQGKLLLLYTEIILHHLSHPKTTIETALNRVKKLHERSITTNALNKYIEQMRIREFNHNRILSAIGVNQRRQQAAGTSGRPFSVVDGIIEADVIHIKGDGNCLFRSIAKSEKPGFSDLELNKVIREYRRAVTDHICQSGFLDKNERDEYCKQEKMMRDSVWGGEREVAALADILKRPIGVYIQKYPNNSRIFMTGKSYVYGDSVYKIPIHLSYDGSHYELLEKTGTVRRRYVGEDPEFTTEERKIYNDFYARISGLAKIHDNKAAENAARKAAENAAEAEAVAKAGAESSAAENRREAAERKASENAAAKAAAEIMANARSEAAPKRDWFGWVSDVDGEDAVLVGGALVGVGSFICTAIMVFR